MIIKTASDYKQFIEADRQKTQDNNLKIKNRIAAAEQKKLESIQNMSKSFIDSAKDKFQEDIYFYNNNQEILFIENEPR